MGVWLMLTWQMVRIINNNAHIVFARLGWRTAKAPARYVQALFDDYAERFDQHLMVDLAYAAPNLVRRIIGERLDGRAPEIVDLGCGTGICGPLFRPLAGRLTGVDLSPAMLAIAKQRSVYDALIKADIVQYLSHHKNQFDLCIAADVVVYLGDLRPLLKACAAALKPGGYLAFTVESTNQRGWILQRSGRYAHSRDYIQELARKYRFAIEVVEQDSLRTQDHQPVLGDIWLLRRQ